MRPTPYPLAAVRTQRDQARQRAEADLRAARERLATAAAALSAIEQRVAAHEQLRAQQHRPAGETDVRSSAHVARSGAYAARLHAELIALRAQLTAAQQRHMEQARAVRLSELMLVHAHTQHELLERHYARFLETARKADERAQELEHEELYRWAQRAQRRS